MNVASLALCKELYQASNGSWDIDTTMDSYVWAPYSIDGGETTQWQVERLTESKGIYDWPAYDLGYLLRKLPGYLCLEHKSLGNLTPPLAWVFYHSEKLETVADTPEDAAAKLAIELFKQGILTKS